MRWFVEVSRMGEEAPPDKYCLEAKQWQAALQEVRRKRGDTGPLSKFSIELLDDGYRAVDASQKIRYMVAKAPATAPLVEPQAEPPPKTSPIASPAPLPEDPLATDPQAGAPTSEQPSTERMPSEAPPADRKAAQPAIRVPDDAVPPAPSPSKPAAAASSPPMPSQPVAAAPRVASSPPASAAPSVASSPPKAASSPPAATAPKPAASAPPAAATSPAPVQASSGPAAAVSPTAPSAASAPPTEKVSPSAILPPSDSAGVKPKVNGPAAKGTEAEKPTASASKSAPASTTSKSDTQRLSSHPTQRSLEAAKAPDFQVIRKREDEPSEKSPIVYREYAYAVAPETLAAQAELLIWVRFKEIKSKIDERSERKFVQLAVFDHVFEKRPERAPVATLAWRDWRGDPVVMVHGKKSTAPAADADSDSKASAGSFPPRPASVPPRPVGSSPEAPKPSDAAEDKNSPGQAAADSKPDAEKVVADKKVEPAKQAEPEKKVEAEKPAEAQKAAPAEAEAAAEERPSEPPPSSRRIAPGKRRADEDLIGELFETMHELHFLPDMVSGVEFVLSIVEDMLPSGGAILHVFDINLRQFVVVRAYGKGAEALLLHRTPDVDPFFNSAMRRTHALAVSGKDEKYLGPRWTTLGVEPEEALFGSVQIHGRYLGAIEIANPHGGGKYSQSEANALEYICAQFADFLAARPIVLDADVVLPKS